VDSSAGPRFLFARVAHRGWTMNIRSWLQFFRVADPMSPFLGRTLIQTSTEYLDDDSYGNP
jgi:hypothetical protein